MELGAWARTNVGFSYLNLYSVFIKIKSIKQDRLSNPYSSLLAQQKKNNTQVYIEKKKPLIDQKK